MDGLDRAFVIDRTLSQEEFDHQLVSTIRIASERFSIMKFPMALIFEDVNSSLIYNKLAYKKYHVAIDNCYGVFNNITPIGGVDFNEKIYNDFRDYHEDLTMEARNYKVIDGDYLGELLSNYDKAYQTIALSYEDCDNIRILDNFLKNLVIAKRKKDTVVFNDITEGLNILRTRLWPELNTE